MWVDLAVDGIPAEAFLRPGERVWRWRWNPGAAVGLHTLALVERAGGEERRHSWTLRVAPRKLDQERYEALLEDVQRAAYNIAYSLGGAAGEGAALEREAPWQRSRLEEYYALFEGGLERFERAVRHIAARPREQLRADSADTPLAEAADLDEAALARLTQGSFDEAPPDIAPELQRALRPGGGLLPRRVAATRSTATLDTYEHRLLKHVLGLLWRRARFISGLAEREAARLAWNEEQAGVTSPRLARARAILAGCETAARLLRELRALPLLAQVRPLPGLRPPTPLLQRDPHYREIQRMWQALRQHPFVAFDSPLFSIPIGDLPRLYEIWCALQTVQAMLALGGAVREQHLVAARPPDDEGELLTTVALPEDAPLLVLERDGHTLALRYQPRYRPRKEPRKENQEPGSGEAKAGADSSKLNTQNSKLASLDRHTRVPDLAIEVRSGAGLRVLVLDAKYRLDADGRGVPQDALSDAYAYLGAIGAGSARAVSHALLLYPGTAPAELYPSGTGAIPLLPGRTDELPALLQKLLG
ncbi:MAG TPA: DUF2357 domain-containing protein [Roseiflexaceae bacterium]|nr:DUF2357 domain-containing protein [Roseiflexaceae bacterium]